MNNEWSLTTAKKRFEELVEKAQREGPQCIAKRGKIVVAVISAAEYRRLTQRKVGLVEFFRNSPLRDVPMDRTKEEPFGTEPCDLSGTN